MAQFFPPLLSNRFSPGPGQIAHEHLLWLKKPAFVTEMRVTSQYGKETAGKSVFNLYSTPRVCHSIAYVFVWKKQQERFELTEMDLNRLK